jgi:hypothetical protein
LALPVFLVGMSQATVALTAGQWLGQVRAAGGKRAFLVE